MRVPLSPLLSALAALACACTVTTVDRRPVVYRPAPPPPPTAPPPPVVYQEPAPPPPVVYESRTLYRYFGPHHIPDSIGGGWCTIDGVHEHDFAPENPGWYRFERGIYHYSAPIVITFYDAHPDNHGGWCSLHGPHRHDYYPTRNIHASFIYDRDRRHYYYRGHSAAPAQGEAGHRRDESGYHRGDEPDRHRGDEPGHHRGDEPDRHRGEPDRQRGEPDHRQGEPNWRRGEAHPSAPVRSEAGSPRNPIPVSVPHDPPPGRNPHPIGPPGAFSPRPHPIVQQPHRSTPGQLGPSAPTHASAPGSPAASGAAPPSPRSIHPGEAARPPSSRPDDSKKHHSGSPR